VFVMKISLVPFYPNGPDSVYDGRVENMLDHFAPSTPRSHNQGEAVRVITVMIRTLAQPIPQPGCNNAFKEDVIG
jgi:hypothetical protein